jgi:hypothetical protein
MRELKLVTLARPDETFKSIGGKMTDASASALSS